MTVPGPEDISLAALLAPLADMLGPIPDTAAGAVPVTAVDMYDPASPPGEAGALLLAVGVAAGTLEAEQALDFARRHGVAGIVFTPGRAEPEPQSPDATGPAVLHRSRWASWAELFVQLRRALSDHRATAGTETAAGYHSLSHLANTLATMTGAAITIEDLDSRVLGFSTVEGPVDSLRQETILGQRVPRWRVDELRRSGFLTELWASTGVIYRPADGERPSRLVIAVRNEDEVFGSIWAAETGVPFSPASHEALRLAAQVAIPLFIEAARAGGIRDRARQAALHALLSGEASAAASARALELAPEQCSRVLCCRLGRELDARREDALMLRILAELPGSLSLAQDGTLSVLAPAAPDEPEATLLARLRVALGGIAPAGEVLYVAVGHIAPHLGDVPASAAEARLVLRALEARQTRGADDVRVAALSAVEDDVRVQQLVDLVRADPEPFTRRVTTLLEYDREHNASLTRTLAVYLHTHGSIAETARRMHLHSNSLRYRLQRLAELSGIDLADPHSRLVTELGLRLLGVSGAAPETTSGS